ASGITPQESKWLASLGASLIVPVADTDERLAGVWILGQRQSETPYSANDRRLLQAVAKQATVARENLRLRSHVSQEQRLRLDVLSRLDRESFNLLKECPVCGRCYNKTSEVCDQDGQILTTSLPVERTIDDKYRLDMLIGRGGMGAVY